MKKNFLSNGDAITLFTEIGARFKLRTTSFTGTEAQWEALSDEQKAKYKIVNITDDDDYIGNIVDEVIEDEGAAISSGGVYAELLKFVKKATESGLLKNDGTVDTTKYMPIQSGAGFHNAIYRGKSLGSEVTSDQYDAIDAGAFDDLYIGDYWTIGGIDYVIADFDYWYNCGNTACLKHHVVVVPRVALYNAKMNDSDITTGGYIGSKMYTTYLADAKNTIKTAFGSAHILVHRDLFTNTVSNGIPTAGAWVDSDIDIPNEPMLYGSYIFSAITNGTTIPYLYTIDKSQLALYRHRPDLISNRQNIWLRDVVSASDFAYVSYGGHATGFGASAALGVRPPFGLVKSN